MQNLKRSNSVESRSPSNGCKQVGHHCRIFEPKRTSSGLHLRIRAMFSRAIPRPARRQPMNGDDLPFILHPRTVPRSARVQRPKREGSAKRENAEGIGPLCRGQSAARSIDIAAPGATAAMPSAGRTSVPRHYHPSAASPQIEKVAPTAANGSAISGPFRAHGAPQR